MAHHEVKARTAMIVRLIRFLRDWSQEELAKQAGVHPSEVYRWEAQIYAPSRANLERLAAAARVSLGLVELLAVFALWLLWLGEARSVAAGQAEEEQQQRLVRAAQEGLELEMVQPLRGLSHKERWERAPEDDATRSELAVVWLCTKSVQAAADDAARSLLLARAALRVARKAEPEHREYLEAYALPFEGNALRVASDFQGSETAFVRARALRPALLRAGRERLDPFRLFDLEASLRRDQGRFSEALDLLERALAGGRKPETEGRVLLMKGAVLEQMGDIPGAVAALQQATQKINGEREPRQLFGAQFNLAVNLCHLGRFQEAEKLLPSIWMLAAELENRNDLVRVSWLESRVLAGKGDLEKAISILDRVREAFADRKNLYDAALATLELARLYLRQGRTDRTRELAAQAEPIFRELNVAPRALEAVLLFVEAARQEAATLEMLDQALQALGQGRRGR